MKKDWEYKKIGEICEIINGFAFKSNKYVPQGIRVIRITNVQNGYIEDKDPKFYPFETTNEIERYLLKEGDLLISLTGNVGRVGRLPISMLPAALNQRVACLRKKDNKIGIQFLFHLLNSSYFEDKCIKHSKGAAQLNMSTVWLSNYTVPIPPLSEQKEIVEYLDSSFAKIDKLKENAAKNLEEAKALFQSALKDALEPKEGWENKKLGEVANVIHGKNQKEVLSANGKYPIYGSGGTIMGYATEYLCEAGTTILGRKGTINNPQFINHKFWNVDTAFGISARKDIDSKFLYFVIKIQNWSKMNTGTTLPSLTQAIVKNVTIHTPSLSEQQSIVSFLDSLNEKLNTLQQNYSRICDECDALKQAILRQVFE